MKAPFKTPVEVISHDSNFNTYEIVTEPLRDITTHGEWRDFDQACCDFIKIAIDLHEALVEALEHLHTGNGQGELIPTHSISRPHVCEICKLLALAKGESK